MPRPTTKDQLISDSRTEYSGLERLIANLSPDEMVKPGVMGDWSVKDILAHLSEWHCMVLSWYESGLRGMALPIPAKGFKWSQLPALNQQIYLRYRDQPLDEVLSRFRGFHHQVMKLIDDLTPEELFTPGYYTWTKKNHLAAYIVCCTGGHYRWASTEIRKGIRILSKEAK
ncbi:MAG: ClbS/DfsB family four-helix bundle protein [Anaerolineaceae bacterium]|nr:ClbS/DfsB family four-helix bundle protein [Anaerolineaceae bacterium]